MGDNLNHEFFLWIMPTTKNNMSSLIDNAFRLPSPLPVGLELHFQVKFISNTRSSRKFGGCFASGVIDLGGITCVSNGIITKVWSTAKIRQGEVQRRCSPATPLYGVVELENQAGRCRLYGCQYLEGYKAIGHVVRPPPGSLLWIKSVVFVMISQDACESHDWIWGTNGLNVYSSRPRVRGMKALGVAIDCFMVRKQ
ncbi:hypothetical protein HAX54_031215 [Datura stramonium]|uniref:Uncharacterized protein n=1 Tax=Datura stramonium TaxID=4076 RepID=A0ABS8VBC1_DATST|nr:hypothetical protein [Datura stramonium]